MGHPLAAEDESLTEACIVIGDVRFKPGPLFGGAFVPEGDQFLSESFTQGMDAGLGIILKVTEVLVNAEEREAPGAGGSE